MWSPIWYTTCYTVLHYTRSLSDEQAEAPGSPQQVRGGERPEISI